VSASGHGYSKLALTMKVLWPVKRRSHVQRGQFPWSTDVCSVLPSELR
jgi:hypothetical protein